MNTLTIIKKQINKAELCMTHRSLTPHIVVQSLKFVRQDRSLTAPSATVVVPTPSKELWKHYN